MLVPMLSIAAWATVPIDLRPTVIQSHETSGNKAAAGTMTDTLQLAVTSGNLLFGCFNRNKVVTVSTPTDSLGTTFTLTSVLSAVNGGNATYKQCFYGIAAGSGADTISAAFTAPGATMGVSMNSQEIANVTGTVDVTCSTSAVTTVASLTTSCTTTKSGVFLISSYGGPASNAQVWCDTPLGMASSNGQQPNQVCTQQTGVAGTYTNTIKQNTSAGVTPNVASVMLTIGFRATATIAVTTQRVPDGCTCALYSFTPYAVGGSAAYTWSISSGALPTGLSINSSTGAITGTPSGTGPFTFKLHVTDGTLSADSASITVNIGSSFASFSVAAKVGSNTGHPETFPSNLQIGDIIVITNLDTLSGTGDFAYYGNSTSIVDSLGTVFYFVPLVNSGTSAGGSTGGFGPAFQTFAGIVTACGADTITAPNSVYGAVALRGVQLPALDGTYGNVFQAGATNANVSASLTTVVNNTILYAAGLASEATFSPDGTYTPVLNFNDFQENIQSAYTTAATTGSYTTTWPFVGANNNVWSGLVNLIALRPALAPASCTPSTPGIRHKTQVY